MYSDIVSKPDSEGFSRLKDVLSATYELNSAIAILEVMKTGATEILATMEPSAMRVGARFGQLLLTRLPDEIISNVLRFACHDDVRKLVTFSHVNRRLRAVALGMTRMWTRLSSNTHPGLVRACVERSRSAVGDRGFEVSLSVTSKDFALMERYFSKTRAQSGHDVQKLLFVATLEEMTSVSKQWRSFMFDMVTRARTSASSKSLTSFRLSWISTPQLTNLGHFVPSRRALFCCRRARSFLQDLEECGQTSGRSASAAWSLSLSLSEGSSLALTSMTELELDLIFFKTGFANGVKALYAFLKSTGTPGLETLKVHAPKLARFRIKSWVLDSKGTDLSSLTLIRPLTVTIGDDRRVCRGGRRRRSGGACVLTCFCPSHTTHISAFRVSSLLNPNSIIAHARKLDKPAVLVDPFIFPSASAGRHSRKQAQARIAQ